MMQNGTYGAVARSSKPYTRRVEPSRTILSIVLETCPSASVGMAANGDVLFSNRLPGREGVIWRRGVEVVAQKVGVPLAGASSLVKIEVGLVVGTTSRAGLYPAPRLAPTNAVPLLSAAVDHRVSPSPAGMAEWQAATSRQLGALHEPVKKSDAGSRLF
jgi:hypothetical protein